LNSDSPFAPWIESAERVAAASRRYLDDVQTGGPAAAAAATTFGDFLRLETMSFFRFPWSADPGAGRGATPPPSMPPTPAALGPGREHQLRGQRAAAAGERVSAAQRRLHVLWSDALRDAATAFLAQPNMAQPVPGPGPGAAPDDAPGLDPLRGLYDSWVDRAEEAYARMAHGDAFCSALADYLNAASAWRKETQEGIELWAKALDLPTRSELNTLMRRISSLEDELRKSQAPATAPARPAPAPARRAKRPRTP
jgi:hypothetical protein